MNQMHYTCKWCLRTSYNSNDATNRYCSCCGSEDDVLPKDCEHRKPTMGFSARAFEAYVAAEEEKKKPAREVFEEYCNDIELPKGFSLSYDELHVWQGFVTFCLVLPNLQHVSKNVNCLTIRDVIGGPKTICDIIGLWVRDMLRDYERLQPIPRS